MSVQLDEPSRFSFFALCFLVGFVVCGKVFGGGCFRVCEAVFAFSLHV